MSWRLREKKRRNIALQRRFANFGVATSSGESCRSSSDSASSAPCSPESVISDSGGAEGLPDSVASLVSGELSDVVAPPLDSGFNLSRLLLPQHHRQGETAAEARKRDLRLVDEVVAAAAAASTTSEPRTVASPASPRPQSSTSAASVSLSSASCLSSSSPATATATSSTAACSSISISPSSAAERVSVNGTASTPAPSVASLLPSVSVSSSSGCSAVTTVALCVTSSAVTSAAVCRQTLSKCGGVLPPTSSPTSSPTSPPHPGSCAKSSRRKRRLSGDSRKRDSPPVSDEDEAEDEDICRRREAEVESLLRHCIDLVVDRLDPQHCASSTGSRDEDSRCLLESQTTVGDNATPANKLSTAKGSILAVTPKVSLTAAASSTTTTTASKSSTSSLPGAFTSAPSPCSSSSQSSTGTASVAAEDGLFACRWVECEVRLRSEDALGDHVRGAHVDTQTRDQGVYLCRWQGCKVFERNSCSRQWLERHVTLSHCGSRPFPCIVAGCGQRYGSQAALQRHVNAHFERSLNGSGPVPLGGGAGNSASGSGVSSGGSLLGSRGLGSKELANGESPLKLLRLRKKLKCRRRAWATGE
ncbi:hypothetical protein MRX96_027881 [Rhipicephalus microplus]